MIKTVSVDEFEKLIKTWEYEVIDIRTQQELDYFWVIPWITKHLDVYTKIDEKIWIFCEVYLIASFLIANTI